MSRLLSAHPRPAGGAGAGPLVREADLGRPYAGRGDRRWCPTRSHAYPDGSHRGRRWALGAGEITMRGEEGERTARTPGRRTTGPWRVRRRYRVAQWLLTAVALA